MRKRLKFLLGFLLLGLLVVPNVWGYPPVPKSGDATTLLTLAVEVPDAADDGKYLYYDHGTTSWKLGTPAGGGDMTEAVWDGDSDGFIDTDAGGLDIDISAATGLLQVAAGTVTASDTLARDFTLDDGAGDSPSLILQDADNNQLVFIKADSGSAIIRNTEDAGLALQPNNDTDDYFQLRISGNVPEIDTTGSTALKISADGGDITFCPDGDDDDCIVFSTAANVPSISSNGGASLQILSASGSIGFGDDNLTTSGTLAAGATTITGNFIQRVDAAAYVTISTADGGATTIAQTSDGTDQITIGDGVDRVDIASDSWDVTNGAISGVTTITTSGTITSGGTYDVTGANPITIGSADVTVITLQTDDTGDGTDLVLPAQSVNGSEILNNTITATQLAAALTFADGDQVDLTGITYVNAATTNEGIAIPTYVAGSAPADNKPYMAYDAANNRIMVYEAGGWADTSSGTGAAASSAFVTWQADGGLSAEQVLTAGALIDVTLAGGDGGAATIAVDLTEAGALTFGDGSNASNVYTFDVSGTDHTMTAGNGVMAFGDAVTVADTLGVTGVATVGGITIGAAAITEAELEILDGATLGTADINIIDGISDSGTLTAAELLYVDGVTSAIQTQLDARALESVIGDSIEADDLELSGTTLQLVAEIPHLDAAANISAVWETQDDVAEAIGSDADWTRTYDETTDDRLEYVHAAGAGADVYWDLNDNAADSTYTITNSDATYEANLVIEGDVTIGGTVTITGGTNSYLKLNNNTTYNPTDGAGYLIYFEGAVLKSFRDDTDTESILIAAADSPTLTGSWDFSTAGASITLPTTAADSSGEISMSTGNQLKWHDGTKVVTIDTTPTDDNYVLKYDNATATFTLEADETGGSPAWSTVADPTLDVTIDHDAGEETAFTFSGNFTTGDQFRVAQITGNPSGGTLFAVEGDDDNIVLAQFGDTGGSHYWRIAEVSANNYQLLNAGSATLNLAAATDLLIAGSQIALSDLATGVPALAADSVDTITEIAAALKSGSDGTLITGTAGTDTYTAVWNADGDLVDGYDPATKADVAGDTFTGNVLIDDGTTDSPILQLINQSNEKGELLMEETAARLTIRTDATANIGFFPNGDTDDGIEIFTIANVPTIAADGGTTISFNDNSLTNLGDLAIDSISADATNISIVAASGTVTVESVVFTGGALTGVTSIETDAIDVNGAADLDIGSADVTDITFISDGDYVFTPPANTDITVTFTGTTNSGSLKWMEDEATHVFSNVLANTPQAKTYNADDTTETVGSDITSSVVLITTDNDATDETVDIQNGTVDGQMVTFICVSGCDGTDDGVNIDVETDSTCTGCDSSGVYALGTNGDSVTIVWDATAIVWYEVGYKIQ